MGRAGHRPIKCLTRGSIQLRQRGIDVNGQRLAVAAIHLDVRIADVANLALKPRLDVPGFCIRREAVDLGTHLTG